MAGKLHKYKSFGLSLLVLLIALLTRVTTLSGTFIVNDETLYWTWTNEFTIALLNFDWAGTLVGKGYPSITVFWVHDLGLLLHFLSDTLQGYDPAGFWQRAALDQPFVFDLLGQRRLAMAVANALLIWLIFFQAKWLLGETVAFFGAGLMVLAPFLLADARTMRGDALMSSLMLISVLAFLLFLRDGRWRQLILSAVALGLAVLTKITAIPVAGWALLAVGVYLWQQRDLNNPTRRRWAMMGLILWGVITALTVIAFWPALWVTPLAAFEFVRDYAASSIDGRFNYFWGRLTFDEPLPLFYPNAFLFRATPLMVLGVAVSTGLVLITAYRLLASTLLRLSFSSPLRRFTPSTHWTLLALGAYAVIYWLVLNAGALKRDRYLMPVFPAAALIAAVGLLWLVKQAGRRWPGRNLPRLLAGGRWAWLVLSLLAGLELGHILTTHPFYYTYWSPLMGGGTVAARAMMAEGGVESSALVELSQRPQAKNETVAVLYSRDFAPAFVGRTVRLNNNDPWITAHHILLRLYHQQTEPLAQHLQDYIDRNPPERIVEFQGYPWGWLYPGPAAQYNAGSLLDGKVELLGYNLSGSQVSPEQPLRVKLFWQNKGYQPLEHIFVRLVDAGGFIWAETVAQPLPEFEPAAGQLDAIVEGEALLQIPPGTPPALYFLKMGVTGPEDEPDIGEFVLPSAGSQIVLEKSVNASSVALNRPANQKVSQDLTLLGADVPLPFILTPQTPQVMTLYWRAEKNMTEDYTAAIHLLNADGSELAYWLGDPARGLYPSSNWRQDELIRDPWTLDLTQANRLADSIRPGHYSLSLSLFKGESNQAVGQVALGDIEVAERRKLFTPPPIAHPLKVQLGEVINLLGYDLAQAPLTGGARFTLKLYWQAAQPIPLDYTVFTQVLDPAGVVIGQHDGIPANGALPTSVWDAGEIIPDRHQIDFPLAQNERYRLIVGMYNPLTGERLPVVDSNGHPGGDFLQLYTFEITQVAQ